MTQFVSFVQSSTYDLTPGPLRLPPVVWTTFAALNKVHGLWRWYRRIELYRQPDNLMQLLGGHIIDKVVGKAYVLRVAAQCLLVATRILECVQQQAEVCRCGKVWWNAIKGHYPKNTEIKWEDSGTYAYLSPSTVHWFKMKGHMLWARIERVALLTLNLFKEAFKLSMTIMDVIDVFCWSPETSNEGVRESFVNITKWMDTAVNNKDELLAGIQNNRDLIERLLKKSPFTYEQLYQGVSSTLDGTEILAKGIKKVSKMGGGALIESGKKAISGVMVVAGLSKLRPLALAPNPTMR